MGQQTLTAQDLQERFVTSGSGQRPTEDKVDARANLRLSIMDAATTVDLATTQATARIQAIFLTKLEEALMWGNKAIFSEED
jgi:uncharacterized protein YggE